MTKSVVESKREMRNERNESPAGDRNICAKVSGFRKVGVTVSSLSTVFIKKLRLQPSKG